MANYLGAYVVQLTDVNGDSATATIDVEYADSITLSSIASTTAAVAGYFAACSNAKVTAQGFRVGFVKAQISAATAPPPANAVYPSVTDGAQLTFADSAGNKRKVTIPAPLLTDFKTNSNVVNPVDTNIAALIAGIETLPELGGTPNVYEGGIKTAHHARKRVARKSL